MNLKMQMIQFVSIANWIQMKLSENDAKQKKGSVSLLELILESISGSLQTIQLSKTVADAASDASKQPNHHQQ
jgi:hypothetical protein